MMDIFALPLVPEAPAVVTVVGAHFTATEIILIISAITSAATAILGQWRNGAKTDKVGAKADMVVDAVIGTTVKPGVVGKVDKVEARVEEIHTLTNSTMSEMRAKLDRTEALVLSQAGVIQELTSERNKKEMRDAYEVMPAKAAAQPGVDQVTLTAPAPVAVAIADAVASKVTPVVTTEIKEAADKLSERAVAALENMSKK